MQFRGCIFLLIAMATLCRAQAGPSDIQLVIQSGITGPGANNAVFSPDGRYVAADDVLWDTRTGLEYADFPAGAGAGSIGFSRDSTSLATTGVDGRVRLWSLPDCSLKWTSERLARRLQALTFVPGAVIVGGEDGTIRWLDAATGRETRKVNAHTESVFSLAVDRDGRVLVSGGVAAGNGEVKVWDPKTGALLHAFQGHPQPVWGVAVSPDGGLVAGVGGNNGGMTVWNAATGKIVQSLPNAVGRAVTFSMDGKWLAGAVRNGLDTRVQLWEVATGREGRSLNFGSPVTSIAFAPQGDSLAVTGVDAALWLYDWRSGKDIRAFRGACSAVEHMAWSRDGKLLATVPDDHYTFKYLIHVWDCQTGKEAKRLAGHKGEVCAVAFSPDGTTLASGDGGGVIKLWDMKAGVEIFSGAVSKQPGVHRIAALTWSADGRTLACASGDFERRGEVTLWGVPDHRLIRTMPVDGSSVQSLAFSADSSLLAGGRTDGQISLWNAAGDTAPRSLKGHQGTVWSVAFSPKGRVLASASQDRAIKLWDTDTGMEQITFAAREAPVNSVAFSADGRQVVAGDETGAVSAWRVPTGQPLGVVSRHNRMVTAVAIGPRDMAVSSGIDGVVRFLDLAHSKEIATFIPGGDMATVVTPDGYYATPGGDLSAIGFRMDGQTYSANQFDVRFNRPDIVLGRIGNLPEATIAVYRAAYEKRLQRLGSSRQQVEGAAVPPTLALVGARPPSTTAEKTIAFRVEAGDSRPVPLHLDVRVNGVPAFGTAGRALKPPVSGAQDIQVELTPGDNHIEVSAIDPAGISSLPERFIVTCTAPAEKPDLYIAAIGVSVYDQSRYRLTYAAKDARDLTTFFTAHAQDFLHTHVLTLTDAEAAHDNILSKVHALFAAARPEDEVILFLAGHGVLNSKLDYYYAPSDMDFANPTARGLSRDEIAGLLDNIRSRRKLLLMDTCHSGEVDKSSTVLVPVAPGVRGTPGRDETRDGGTGLAFHPVTGLANSFLLMQELFSDLNRDNGAAVISASSGVGFSLESEQWKNGVFTASLLEALLLNPDAGVSSLEEQVAGRVQELTSGQQAPIMRKGAFDFRVL